MIDNTDSTGMMDPTSAANSTGGVVPGADPGSWVGVTGTLPADLPPANTPGSPAVAAAMAGSSSSSAGGMSTSMKLALAIGAGAVLLGLVAVTSRPSRRR
jgi:hypothetical protein